MVTILLGVFVVSLLLEVPIAFAIGAAGLVAVWFGGSVPAEIVVYRMFSGTDSFVLTAIPFFILAGHLMTAGGVTRRLMVVAEDLIGSIRGGLGMANVVVNMVYAGISGSASADTAAVGSVMIPEMVRRGYDRDFAGAITASSGTIGIIIPPSVIMVLYGVLAGVSIGDLFLAGAIPGVLFGLALMACVYVISVRRGYPVGHRTTLRQFVIHVWQAIPALGMPTIILGGIVGGIVTPTEAAAMAVYYALFVGFLVYRELKVADLPRIFLETVTSTGAIMLIMGVATLFSWLLANEQIPQRLTTAMLSFTSSKVVLLLLTNVLLLLLGTIMDTVPIMIIVGPVLFGLMKSLGIDLVHFGIIMTVNLGIGLFTPPVGTNLYIVCNVGDIKLWPLSRAIWPFVAASAAVLMLITYVPAIVMYLPTLFKQ